jgi:putative transposase
VKYAWIAAQVGWQPIARLCNVLSVSRSGFLHWRHRGPSERDKANQSLDARVAVIHAEGKQGYGRIRITRRLRQAGMRVGAERVRRSLLRQRLRSVYRRPYRVTTDSHHRKPIAQNLLNRRFHGWPADRAWTTDITYLATDEGWLYLAAISVSVRAFARQYRGQA